MPQQMINNDVPVINHVLFGEVEVGWMREDGKIFFLHPWGRETICSLVFEDGTISTKGETRRPNQLVELVHPHSLGIKELRWV